MSVDPVGDDLAQVPVLEIVGVDLDRLALGPVVAPSILEFAEQFLLLGVDRDHGLTGGLKRFDLGVDVFKLGIAIGMVAPLFGLAVEVATIFQLRQEFGNGRGTHFVTHPAKRRRQLVVAFGDPSQGPHGIAHRRGVEQSLRLHARLERPERLPTGLLGRGPAFPCYWDPCFCPNRSREIGATRARQDSQTFGIMWVTSQSSCPSPTAGFSPWRTKTIISSAAAAPARTSAAADRNARRSSPIPPSRSVIHSFLTVVARPKGNRHLVFSLADIRRAPPPMIGNLAGIGDV